MVAGLEVEQNRLLPPDARKRIKEVIAQRQIVTFREIRGIAKTEGWDFGVGVDILDYIIAQESLGKIEILQPLIHSAQNPPRDIYIVSRSLLETQESSISR